MRGSGKNSTSGNGVTGSAATAASSSNITGSRGGAEATLRTAATTGTGTASVTARVEEIPATPEPDPNTQLISRVSEALQSVGLDPAQFNLNVGAMEIVFPGKPTYDYPVLWANVNGQQTGFYLQGAMQNPGMVAINISGMMGRPVMHLI